ncbi:MAG: hypothetical protein OEU54_07105, partial [Gemmatimonadota bacterium]|nr:hypothetical protein [Gemmatimonadota bacterium]
MPALIIACSAPAPESEVATPTSDARALLSRSIGFHDPGGVWSHRSVSLSWNGTGSESEERVALDITMEPDGTTFSMAGRYRG